MRSVPYPTVLGTVLAGGQSSRFGSDKALAVLAGRTLLDRAIDRLGALCGDVVVAGRSEARVACVADRPAAGMGPLGGIAGALAHAVQRGFSAVLTLPVDGAGIAPEALGLLFPGPACCESQPVIGLWPVSALAAIDAILAGPHPHSLRRFAQAAQARNVAFPVPPANINTPDDLAAAERTRAG